MRDFLSAQKRNFFLFLDMAKKRETSSPAYLNPLVFAKCILSSSKIIERFSSVIIVAKVYYQNTKIFFREEYILAQ